MSKKRVYLLIIVAILLLCIVFTFNHFFISHSRKVNNYPVLELKGSRMIQLQLGEEYQEKGYVAHDDHDGSLTKKVKVKNNIDNQTPGTYEITYKVTNSLGNTIEAKRFVNIKLSTKAEYKAEYDQIDNTINGWGTNNKRDGKRPTIDISNEELKKYGAYAMGADEKVLYLTFDEGNNETYLEEIVKILDQNDVQATFFLCRHYIESHPELMRHLVEKGHSVGNHTSTHPSMPSLATKAHFEKYLNELIVTEEAFEKATGKPMDHIYREPKGEYSLRSLSIVKDLGYKTYFWSAAYQDWDDKLTKEEALESMMERVHNGAIYLLHPTSKGNYMAMDDFIKTMKKEGYTFDLVKNID